MYGNDISMTDTGKKKGWGGNGGRSQESQESSCFYTAYILEVKGRDE